MSASPSSLPVAVSNVGDALGRDEDALGRNLPEGTYIELVRSLFVPVIPTIIMTLNFAAAGYYLIRVSADQPLAWLYALGLFASAIRIAVLLGYRRPALSAPIEATEARRIEQRYAIAYLGFAVMFGLFSARAFAIASPSAHILLVALIYGYAAGVATGISLRPWISIPSVLVALVPTILVSLTMPGLPNWGVGLISILFLVGGIESMIRRYRATSKQISMHRLLATLARHDELTGLPNRLSLRERFEQFAGTAQGGDLIAIHRLDLNRFKPINEGYGQQVGDAVLKAVAERLNRIVRGDSFAVRLAADDFLIVQSGVTLPREIDLLARQIAATIEKSYWIAGNEIDIPVTVGYAYATQQGADLDPLLAQADEAMRRAKREASGVAGHSPSRWTNHAVG
jgi:diguanylate cyclase (GGDEF)-like protein